MKKEDLFQANLLKLEELNLEPPSLNLFKIGYLKQCVFPMLTFLFNRDTIKTEVYVIECIGVLRDLINILYIFGIDETDFYKFLVDKYEFESQKQYIPSDHMTYLRNQNKKVHKKAKEKIQWQD